MGKRKPILVSDDGKCTQEFMSTVWVSLDTPYDQLNAALKIVHFNWSVEDEIVARHYDAYAIRNAEVVRRERALDKMRNIVGDLDWNLREMIDDTLGDSRARSVQVTIASVRDGRPLTEEVKQELMSQVELMAELAQVRVKLSELLGLAVEKYITE